MCQMMLNSSGCLTSIKNKLNKSASGQISSLADFICRPGSSLQSKLERIKRASTTFRLERSGMRNDALARPPVHATVLGCFETGGMASPSGFRGRRRTSPERTRKLTSLWRFSCHPDTTRFRARERLSLPPPTRLTRPTRNPCYHVFKDTDVLYALKPVRDELVFA